MSNNRRWHGAKSQFTAGVALVVMVVLTLLAGSVVPAAAATKPSATKPSVWGEDDGNAAANRSNPNETTLSTSTVTQLSLRRGLTVPRVSRDAYCGYRGIDIAAATATMDFAEGNGHLSAFDPATGKVRWSIVPDHYFATLYESIAVTDGLVIMGEIDCVSQSDPSGVIEAYNATTGKLVWRTGIASALYSVVVSGPYVVETGASVGSGQLTSVRRVATGALVWQQTGTVCGTYGRPVIIVDQQVITHTCDPDTYALSLTAFRLADGALSWTRAVDWQIERGDSGAAGARHLLVRDDNGDIDELDPVTGMTQYYNFDATSVLAVDTTRAYAKCGSKTVCAFVLATGDTLWSTADSSTLAAEANGVLYLGDGRMLDATTGVELGRLFTTGSASILFVAGGRVGVVITAARTVNLYGRSGS